jgi:hypothetical protein
MAKRPDQMYKLSATPPQFANVVQTLGPVTPGAEAPSDPRSPKQRLEATRDVSSIRALGRADRLPARQGSRDRHGVSRAQSAGGGDDLAPILRLAVSPQDSQPSGKSFL